MAEEGQKRLIKEGCGDLYRKICPKDPRKAEKRLVIAEKSNCGDLCKKSLTQETKNLKKWFLESGFFCIDPRAVFWGTEIGRKWTFRVSPERKNLYRSPLWFWNNEIAKTKPKCIREKENSAELLSVGLLK